MNISIRTMLAAAVFIAAPPIAQAQDLANQCSLHHLKGTYGYTATGIITSLGNFPFAAVGSLTFDNAGNVTGSDTASGNGTIVTRTLTGTAILNGECTGSLSLAFVGPPFDGPASVNFVLDDGSKELRAIQTSPAGVVLTIEARKR